MDKDETHHYENSDQTEAVGLITAICPGSYDPVTNGHVDVITRSAQIFDRVVVGVVGAPQHKTPTFPVEERIAFVREATSTLPNVEVDVFKELVVEFARRWEARVIVKGLRVISDFEWEFQMNQLNRTLAPDIETVYVMASPAVSFVSSSGVKEIAAFGGNVEELVPPAVARRLREIFPGGRGGTPLNDQE
jgi:pantetheine-phosphate adenylyltransferase